MKNKKLTGILLVMVLMLALLAGCGSQQTQSTEPASQGSSAQESTDAANQAPAQPQNPEMILATTTSTYDTGLLDVLIPMFEEQTGYKVSPVAVGTGAALEMGKKGDADVLLVHAPASEEKLVASKDAINRQLVMHNDFIIVGPASDPAGIKGLTKVSEALQTIADKKALFASRGDNSGTNKKEIEIWQEAGIEPSGSWYIETGKGMGDTLTISSEEEAYTLTDRGTYLALKGNLQLDILNEGDESLKNIYHVMQVNPETHENINSAGAKAFVDFMLDKDTQKVIKEFGVDKYGQPLFFPDAL